MRHQVLRVVESTDAAAHMQAPAQDAQTPLERVFAHWVFMLGRKRAALGPTRRKVVEKMLALYDEETLLLAIEGNASSAWHAGDNDRGRAYDDIEFILHNEERVERFAALGEALRERVRRRYETAEKVVPIAPADPAAIAAQRAALREVAARLAGRKVARHG